MVWGSNENYYTIGDTPYPEDQTTRENQQPYLDLRCERPCWHCGGKHMTAMHLQYTHELSHQILTPHQICGNNAHHHLANMSVSVRFAKCCMIMKFGTRPVHMV